MSAQDQQSVKLPTPLLERVATLTEEWTQRDGGIVRWTRAMVLDLVMLRGLEACEQTTTGGLAETPSRPPRVVKSTTTGGLEAPKETRAPARKRTRAAASAGGNKTPSAPPDPSPGAAPPPPPTPDPPENGAEATPARTHAYEPAVEVPTSAAGTPRSGTPEASEPTPERPPPRALRVIDGGISNEPTLPPLTDAEEAALIAEAIAKQDRLRAAHNAAEAEKAEQRRIAGEAWKAEQARKQAELEAYYERNPNGRGVPT